MKNLLDLIVKELDLEYEEIFQFQWEDKTITAKFIKNEGASIYSKETKTWVNSARLLNELVIGNIEIERSSKCQILKKKP